MEETMNKLRTADFSPVARTLLATLACRAEESARPDAIIRDDRAWEILARFEAGDIVPLKLGGADLVFTMMRARQFDRWAKAFLEAHPGGIVADIGCGLDTRAARVDDGRRLWYGLDLPEVIALRRMLMPPGSREHLIEGSVTSEAWMNAIAAERKPVLFIAEGVFPYLQEQDLRRTFGILAERFPGSELAFDALTKFSIRLHNMHPLLRKAGARLNWGLDGGRDLERWDPRIRWIETWKYFDHFEPRLGGNNLMRFVPVMADANYLARYRLGGA
jgi:O-methyltransferase involved in polyketide biosynthesis